MRELEVYMAYVRDVYGKRFVSIDSQQGFKDDGGNLIVKSSHSGLMEETDRYYSSKLMALKGLLKDIDDDRDRSHEALCNKEISQEDHLYNIKVHCIDKSLVEAEFYRILPIVNRFLYFIGWRKL